MIAIVSCSVSGVASCPPGADSHISLAPSLVTLFVDRKYQLPSEPTSNPSGIPFGISLLLCAGETGSARV